MTCAAQAAEVLGRAGARRASRCSTRAAAAATTGGRSPTAARASTGTASTSRPRWSSWRAPSWRRARGWSPSASGLGAIEELADDEVYDNVLCFNVLTNSPHYALPLERLLRSAAQADPAPREHGRRADRALHARPVSGRGQAPHPRLPQHLPARGGRGLHARSTASASRASATSAPATARRWSWTSRTSGGSCSGSASSDVPHRRHDGPGAPRGDARGRPCGRRPCARDRARSCSANIGWTGVGASNAFESEHVACVVDGAVYDAPAGRVRRRARRRACSSSTASPARSSASTATSRSRCTIAATARCGLRATASASGRSTTCATAAEFAFASRPRAAAAAARRVEARSTAATRACSRPRTTARSTTTPTRSPYEDVAQLPAAHLLRVAGRAAAQASAGGRSRTQGDLDAPAERAGRALPRAAARRGRLRVERSRAPGVHALGRHGLVVGARLGRAPHGRAAARVLHALLGQRVRRVRRDPLDARRRRRGVAPGARSDRPDVLELVAQMVEAHDEPVATATWLSHYVLCGEVAAGGLRHALRRARRRRAERRRVRVLLLPLRRPARRGRGGAARRRRSMRGCATTTTRSSARAGRRWRQGFARLVDFQRPGRILPDRARIERYRAALEPDLLRLRGVRAGDGPRRSRAT